VDRNLFMGFPFQAGLPRLFGGFLDLVFDRSTGVLLDAPSIDAIRAVRQLTLMYGKILLKCSDARVQNAMDGFVQCEQEVRTSDALVSSKDLDDFHRIGRLLYARVFNSVDHKVYNLELVPKHGPGVTADRLLGNQKYRQLTWPARLERYFPYGDYALPNYRYYDSLDPVDFLEPEREIPARVVSVPKTLKTPRIIAVEPTAMQYCQQAIADELWSSIRRDDNLRRMIGHKDQERNQALACEGSLLGNLATLDLSEASDRVSNQHVRLLMHDHPNLLGAVDASRSRKADVQGHGIISLAKFASMGSALCFPVEAMVFLTMIFVGIERELSTPLTPRLIKSLRDQVRVYGDDIIIPVDYVQTVIATLESFGIRVNRNKSFWTGRFRESCGKEYFAGHDVSIVRVRRVFPLSRQCVPELVSLVSLRNQLYWAFCWDTVEWLDSQIEKLIKHFPVVGPDSPVLGKESIESPKGERIDQDTQTPLVKGYVVRARSPRDQLSDEYALMKCLLRLERKYGNTHVENLISNEYRRTLAKRQVGSLPTVDDEHLERAGRPQYVSIKLKWASPV